MGGISTRLSMHEDNTDTALSASMTSQINISERADLLASAEAVFQSSLLPKICGTSSTPSIELALTVLCRHLVPEDSPLHTTILKDTEASAELIRLLLAEAAAKACGQNYLASHGVTVMAPDPQRLGKLLLPIINASRDDEVFLMDFCDYLDGCFSLGFLYQFGCNFDEFTYHSRASEEFIQGCFIELCESQRATARAPRMLTWPVLDASGPPRVWPLEDRLLLIDDFVQPDELARLCSDCDELERGGQLDVQMMKGHRMTTRMSRQTFLPDAHPIARPLQKRLRDLFQCATSRFEALSLTAYGPGGFYKVHHDGPMRLYTFLMYLNDDFEGGATTFPCLGVSVTPKKGRLVAWRNGHAHGMADNLMLHYAEPVTAGRKMVCQQWVGHP